MGQMHRLDWAVSEQPRSVVPLVLSAQGQPVPGGLEVVWSDPRDSCSPADRIQWWTCYWDCM